MYIEIIFVVGAMSDNKPGGLIFSDGVLWRDNRRFTLHHLRDLGFGKGAMEVIIDEEVKEFIAYLKKSDGEPVE